MLNDINGQLFVYGTLRSGFHHSAYEYISRYFSLVSATAKTKGRVYNLGSYPAAIPSNEDYFIIGELYKIIREEELSWALAQLDDYEGVNVEPGETALYQRSIATIYLPEQITTANVYWYAGDITNYPIIESGDILAYLQQQNNI